MLSSLLRPRKARQRVQEHSPFSSPFPEPDLSSPLIARRDRQVRHATADWTETEADDDDSDDDEDGHPGRLIDDDVVEADEEEDDGHEGNEDGDDESPLLPIFSAAHLGILYRFGSCDIYIQPSANSLCRCAASIQLNPRHTTYRPPKNRNNPNLGPTTLTASLPIPGQADAAANTDFPLLPRDIICSDGKSPTV